VSDIGQRRDDIAATRRSGARHRRCSGPVAALSSITRAPWRNLGRTRFNQLTAHSPRARLDNA